MRFGLYRAAAATAGYIPERLGYRLFGWLGDLAWLFGRDARRLITANLTQVAGANLDRRQLRRTSRLAFRNLLWGYYELFSQMPLHASDRAARLTIHGMEQISHWGRDGPGAIFLFAHVGSLEAASQLLGSLDIGDVAVVVGEVGDERIQRLFDRQRSSAGRPMISPRYPRRLIDALQAGISVALAGDLDSTQRGCVVEFFGKPARMPVGGVRLALRTGAQLHIVHGWRTSQAEPWRHELCVHEPLGLNPHLSRKRTIEAGVRQVAKEVERIVAEHPEQWLAFRDIWIEA